MLKYAGGWGRWWSGGWSGAAGTADWHVQYSDLGSTAEVDWCRPRFLCFFVSVCLSVNQGTFASLCLCLSVSDQYCRNNICLTPQVLFWDTVFVYDAIYNMSRGTLNRTLSWYTHIVFFWSWVFVYYQECGTTVLTVVYCSGTFRIYCSDAEIKPLNLVPNLSVMHNTRPTKCRLA